MVAAFNSETPAGVNLRPNQSRSQLATNDILVSLGRVYGRGIFSSREVSDRLGLDFLYTAKVLCRMSKRPYYLLSVTRKTRVVGGFENSYAISPRGFKRINYIQTRPAAAKQNPSSNLLKLGWAAHYLLNGSGKENETASGVSFKTILESSVFKSQPIATAFDEIGIVLTCLDHRLLPVEPAWNSFVKPPLDEQLRTVRRASYLQQIGLVSNGIDVGSFVQNAYLRGSSESMILFSLLIRGAIKLRDEAIALAVTIGCKQFSYMAQASSPDHSNIECGNCLHYQALSDEKHRNRLLELENDLLTQKLEKTSFDALTENFRLSNRIQHLTRHIVNISEWLALIPEYLDQIRDPPFALIPVKSFVRTTLRRVVFMNYLVVSNQSVTLTVFDSLGEGPLASSPCS
jgi:hypothetical protein